MLNTAAYDLSAGVEIPFCLDQNKHQKVLHWVHTFMFNVLALHGSKEFLCWIHLFKVTENSEHLKAVSFFGETIQLNGFDKWLEAFRYERAGTDTYNGYDECAIGMLGFLLSCLLPPVITVLGKHIITLDLYG